MDNNDEAVAKSGNRQMGPIAENSDGGTGDSNSGNRSNMTPPAKPTDSDGNEMRMGGPMEMDCDTDNETCEMPEDFDGEMPEDFDGEMPADFQGGGFGGRGGLMTEQNVNPDAVWHPVAYLAMGAGSVILGILISYACFSKCFHLKPGQTFATLPKFIWFIVVALLVAIGFSALGFFIPKWVG